MNFDSAAREIVANSIRSAVCIDDEFVGPYNEKKGKVKEIKKPQQLMESFRKSNCSLDIHTYTSYRELEKETEFVFKNRDLLILDWELTDDPIKFKDALEILKDASENPSLAFVLIYTQEQGLDGIELQIRSFFNSINNEKERKKTYENLEDHLDENFFDVETINGMPDDAETFFKDKKVRNTFNEFVSAAPSNEAIKKFKTGIRGYFPDQKTGAKFLKIFEESVKKLYNCGRLYEGCEQIEFRNRSTYTSKKEHSSLLYCHKISGQEHALWVNNTYITILHKDNISPASVYERFSHQLCSKPGNIMSLISMEMKNNFRENSGKVGKDLLAVDEFAFFHHRNNLPGKEEFYDFLRNNWKQQVASFHMDSDSKVFCVLDEYIEKNQINDKIDKILEGNKKEDFQKELAKLNYQYSFHHSKRKKNDSIRFGYIFSIRESPESHEIKGYLLNITAHCDCLRPEKIRNNFHFVPGEAVKLSSALEKVDNENCLYSFLFRSDESVCISWGTKPFTIFLPEKKKLSFPNKPIKVKIDEEIKYLFYEGALLENYTQRIANKSFAHAVRVGVDLAKFEPKQEPKKK
ncbi:MAG: hypothetical protein KAW12_03630 [Candidatus Aminicenantes bacterium]|nr:hypothetical protein [Candidatus Aminicenantes bacterium]